jgi:5-methylcytosine-specific restriction endonuclease McrA
MGSWAQIRIQTLFRDRFTCQACRNRLPNKELSAHHILPRNEGGSDSPRNLITLCHPCHDAVEEQWQKYDSHTKIRRFWDDAEREGW